jgi:hypothetical protein
VQFPFFEHSLKGKGEAQPKAIVFETGTNVWRNLDSWPPKAAAPKTLYFQAGGKLSFEPPTEAESSDSYVSDPAHPVPFVGYTTDTVPQRYMVDDQRFASYRPDVLVYESDVLTADVTIAGPISPKLKIASTGTDSDFDVKLIDVLPENYPDPEEGSGRPNKRILDAPPLHMGGYQEMLRGEQTDRGRLQHARSVSHLPCRASHHGAGAIELVPAHRPQSADLYRHSNSNAGAVCEGDRDSVSSEGCGFGSGSAGAAETMIQMNWKPEPAAFRLAIPLLLLEGDFA